MTQIVLEAYQKQAKAALSTIPWLASLQKKALSQLEHTGLPSRADEEWKYTSISALTQQIFTPASRESKPLSGPISKAKLDSYPCLTAYPGQLAGFEELTKQLPAGVLVLPLIKACEQHPNLVKPYLDHIVRYEHGFHYLNAAFLSQGCFIYIPAGVVLDKPLVIQHLQNREKEASYWRHLLFADKDSQVTLVEDYVGSDEVCTLTNVITELYLETGARVSHYKIQRESKKACHLGQISVKQLAGSQFSSHSLSLGGQLVRSDISIELEEPGAQCLMNGIYAPKDNQHIDHHTRVVHRAPSGVSRQDYKGLLSGTSRAVFNGKILVEKDAQHTDAQQQNKNLLLSKQAEVDTKPQLEIYADDVQCSHGATVGRLDEDALFYLATRGINEASANQYLIQAFIQDNLRLVPLPALADWMSSLLIQHME